VSVALFQVGQVDATVLSDSGMDASINSIGYHSTLHTVNDWWRRMLEMMVTDKYASDQTHDFQAYAP